MKLCSSTWADAVAAGDEYPPMPTCPGCGFQQPPIYFAGGLCVDCYLSGAMHAPDEAIDPAPTLQDELGRIRAICGSDMWGYADRRASLLPRQKTALDAAIGGIVGKQLRTMLGIDKRATSRLLKRAVKEFLK